AQAPGIQRRCADRPLLGIDLQNQTCSLRSDLCARVRLSAERPARTGWFAIIVQRALPKKGCSRMKKHKYVFSCVIMMAVVLAGWKAIAQSPVSTPRKVLFIGDSFTYTQGGIYTHFEKLAAAATPPRIVSTDKAVAGGAYLKRLWEMQSPVTAVDTGAFDVVVLQDDIPETNVDYFRQYARMFVDEVRRNKGRPVLFMAWAYQRLSWISMQQIAQEHRELGKELNVDVAPVGLAWQQAAKERPGLDMYASDREHPSI